MDWIGGYLTAIRHTDFLFALLGGLRFDFFSPLLAAIAAAFSAWAAFVGVKRSAQDKFIQLSSRTSDISISMYALKQEISDICHATGDGDGCYNLPDYMYTGSGLIEARETLTQNYHAITELEKRLGSIKEVAFRSQKYAEADRAHRDLLGMDAEFRELRQSCVPKISKLRVAVDNHR